MLTLFALFMCDKNRFPSFNFQSNTPDNYETQ